MSKTICIFGDSITHGVLDEEMGGWANRLMLFFWNNWDKYKTNVYHLGIDGDTSTELLSRFDVEARSRQPNIVIFAIGINDSVFWKDNREMISETDFAKNIEKLIEKAHKHTKEVIFISLTPVVDKILQPYKESESNKCYSNERTGKFARILERVCVAENMHHISITSVISEGDLPDGLHPDARGHEKIFEKVKEFLVENKIIS